MFTYEALGQPVLPHTTVNTVGGYGTPAMPIRGYSPYYHTTFHKHQYTCLHFTYPYLNLYCNTRHLLNLLTLYVLIERQEVI